VKPVIDSGADLSDCGTYRYRLWRYWDPGQGEAVFCMLNPSTADASEDDPTIRRCMGFARAWGYGGIIVVNLFALRSTDPRALKKHPAPIGERNDVVVFDALRSAGIAVAAWGNHGSLMARGSRVVRICAERRIPLHHLGLSKAGHPAHPLYLPGDRRPQRFGEPEAA
jgi:hypothetical protein